MQSAYLAVSSGAIISVLKVKYFWGRRGRGGEGRGGKGRGGEGGVGGRREVGTYQTRVSSCRALTTSC